MRPQSTPSLVIFLLLAVGCGDEEPAEGRERVREAARAALGDGSVPASGAIASHRRLAGFLPAVLPGYAYRKVESEETGRALASKAEGDYRPTEREFAKEVEIEITHWGNPALSPANFRFSKRAGELGELDGFESAFDRGDDPLASRSELWLRITPATLVCVKGMLSKGELEDLARQIDLDGLAAAVEDGTIFKPSAKDLLAKKILTGQGIAALLPTAIGPVERGSGSTDSELDREPMHSSAKGTFGNGTLALYDYGEASIAAAIEVPEALARGYEALMSRGDMSLERAAVPFEGGEAEWAVLIHSQSNVTNLAVRVVAGRFVAEYTAPFQPEPEGLASMPNAGQHLAELRAMGAGAYASPEAQRDAVLEALAGLSAGALE